MPGKGSALRETLLNNKGLKILSLLLAVATWYAIRETISLESVIYDVPLTIAVDKGWAVLDRSTDTVDVQFRGSQEDLLRLSREYVAVTLDVRGESFEGSSVLALGPENVSAPGGARPQFVRPGVVTISLDREVEKQVPVKADIQGSPPEGYAVEKVVCVPASVLVSGPRQRLEEIDAVRTAPIDMEGRLRSFRLRTSVVSPSESWVLARIEPERVVAEVTMVERSASRAFEGVEVKILMDSDGSTGANVQPNKVQVELQGRVEPLERLQAEDIHAHVDCSDLEPGARYELPVQVHAGAGIRVVAIEPAVVSVVVDAQ